MIGETYSAVALESLECTCQDNFDFIKRFYSCQQCYSKIINYALCAVNNPSEFHSQIHKYQNIFSAIHQTTNVLESITRASKLFNILRIKNVSLFKLNMQTYNTIIDFISSNDEVLASITSDFKVVVFLLDYFDFVFSNPIAISLETLKVANKLYKLIKSQDVKAYATFIARIFRLLDQQNVEKLDSCKLRLSEIVILSTDKWFHDRYIAFLTDELKRNVNSQSLLDVIQNKSINDQRLFFSDILYLYRNTLKPGNIPVEISNMLLNFVEQHLNLIRNTLIIKLIAKITYRISLVHDIQLDSIAPFIIAQDSIPQFSGINLDSRLNFCILFYCFLLEECVSIDVKHIRLCCILQNKLLYDNSNKAEILLKTIIKILIRLANNVQQGYDELEINKFFTLTKSLALITENNSIKHLTSNCVQICLGQNLVGDNNQLAVLASSLPQTLVKSSLYGATLVVLSYLNNFSNLQSIQVISQKTVSTFKSTLSTIRKLPSYVKTTLIKYLSGYLRATLFECFSFGNFLSDRLTGMGNSCFRLSEVINNYKINSTCLSSLVRFLTTDKSFKQFCDVNQSELLSCVGIFQLVLFILDQNKMNATNSLLLPQKNLDSNFVANHAAVFYKLDDIKIKNILSITSAILPVIRCTRLAFCYFVYYAFFMCSLIDRAPCSKNFICGSKCANSELNKTLLDLMLFYRKLLSTHEKELLAYHHGFSLLYEQTVLIFACVLLSTERCEFGKNLTIKLFNEFSITIVGAVRTNASLLALFHSKLLTSQKNNSYLVNLFMNDFTTVNSNSMISSVTQSIAIKPLYELFLHS